MTTGASTSENNASKAGIPELSESWTKCIGAALGILFLVGYYLNGYYFTELGIQELSPLRTQHILTGGVFLLFLSAPGIVLLLPWRLAVALCDGNPQIIEAAEGKKRRVLVYAIAILATLYTIFTLILNGITEENSLFFACWSIYYDFRNEVNDDPMAMLILCNIGWLVFFNFGLFWFIYKPSIPRVINRNGMILMQAAFSKWGAIAAMGVGTVCGGYYYSIAVHRQIEEPVGGASYGDRFVVMKFKQKEALPYFFESNDSSPAQNDLERIAMGKIHELFEDEKWIYFIDAESPVDAFKRMDKSKSGFITADEFETSKFGRRNFIKPLQDEFASMHPTADGKVRYAEFEAWCHAISVCRASKEQILLMSFDTHVNDIPKAQ